MNPALAHHRARQQRRAQSLLNRALAQQGTRSSNDATEDVGFTASEANGGFINDDEDEDEDLSMAILLSIQDPRLNDRTLQSRASTGGEGSTISSLQGGASLTEEQRGKVESLAAMGFSDADARRALEGSNWDLELAVYSLLNG